MTAEEARELRSHRRDFGAIQGVFFVFAAVISGGAVGGWHGWKRPIDSASATQQPPDGP